MDNFTQNQEQTNNQLIIDDVSKNFLFETAKWSKLIAILGFIGIGLIMLAGIFSSLFLSALSGTASNYEFISGGVVGFIYLLTGAIYIVPILYLYRFAENLRLALNTQSQETLNHSFEYLKKHYKFLGIIAIAIIALYALIFVFVLLFGASASLF